MSDLSTSTMPTTLYVHAYTGETPKFDTTNFRMSILRWKETKQEGTEIKVPALSTPLYLLIPRINFSVSIPALAAALNIAVCALQDAAAKSSVEDQLRKGTTLPHINVPAIDLQPAALAIFSASQQTSGRISKADAVSWFTTSLQPHILSALRAKMNVLPGEDPTPPEVAKINAALGTYRDKLCALAGPISYSPLIASQLTSAMLLAPAETMNGKVPEYLLARLNKFMESEETTLELL